MSPTKSDSSSSKNNKLNISLDLRLVVVALVLVIGAMLFAWHPWSAATTNDERTITVSGEAKIKAEPDEFIFNPSYEFKSPSKETALADVSKKSDEVVNKLKEIGVAESKIKTNSDGNNYREYYLDKPSNQNTYSLRLTVTADNRELAQKIQDYLVTTEPLGQVSPQSNFSDAKRKELEGKARDEATKDARAKADQSAKNLGFKVGKVKNIDDGTNFDGGGIQPLLGATDMATRSAEVKPVDPSLGIQPGEDSLRYTVTVVYYVR